jgi:predicted DNA-binding transcriptional regulator YafY
MCGIMVVVTETAARLLRLLPLLTARRTWSGEELAERLAVTTRTVRRDIERLRDLGYMITATPGAHGGYTLKPGNSFPPIQLDDDAAVAVALALRSVAGWDLSGVEAAAARATAAIDQVLPARLREKVAAIGSVTVPLPASGPSLSPNVLGLFAQVCRDCERLRFRYVNGAGEESRRHVEPYRLVSAGRRWYLVARDLDAEQWRSFRADRIADPLPTGVRSRPADPPDAARFVSEGISTRPYRWQARVRLEASAGSIMNQVPPTVAVVEADGDERCVLTTGSDSLDAIAFHLAALDVPFTVDEPPELRARCAAIAARLTAAAGRT